MGLNKQAKTLNKRQIETVLSYLATKRNALRNQVVFLLSMKGCVSTLHESWFKS